MKLFSIAWKSIRQRALSSSLTALSVALGPIESGRLRALGVASEARTPLLKNTPTIAESGVPGFDVSIWYGLIGPANLPKPVLAKLHGGVTQTLKAPDVRQTLVDLSLDIIGNTPQVFAGEVKAELDKWREVVRKLGLNTQG